jgi:hypothetical protein
MVQAGRSLGFALEPAQLCLTGELTRGNNLQRYESVQSQVPRFENNSHATATDHFQKLVIPKETRWGVRREEKRIVQTKTQFASDVREFQAQPQEALGAAPAQRAGRQLRPAVRTGSGSRHEEEVSLCSRQFQKLFLA